MGLDQYLTAKVYVWHNEEVKKKVLQENFGNIFENEKISPEGVSF